MLLEPTPPLSRSATLLRREMLAKAARGEGEGEGDDDGDSRLVRAARKMTMLAHMDKTDSMRFSLEKRDFFVDIRDVVKGQKIGEGAFSQVFAGEYFGDVVAVKVQPRARADVEDLEKYVLRELAILQSVSHPNILSYIGACDTTQGQQDCGSWEMPDDASNGHVFVVTEFAANGDLRSLLSRDTPLGWHLRVKMACDAAAALDHVHSKRLIHRDVKSENFLVDSKFGLKLSDFGLARQLDSHSGSRRRMSVCGTDSHMAPEVQLDDEEGYGTHADVFSFGIVLVEIMTRRVVGPESSPPFLVRTPQNLFAVDHDELRAACAEANAPPSLVELACQCCEFEPEMRPTAENVLEWLEDLVEEVPEDDSPMPTPVSVVALNEKGKEGDHPLVPQPPLTVRKTKSDLKTVQTLRQSLPVTRGWLYKRRMEGLKLWRKRWFRLDPMTGLLKWYNGEEEERKGQERGVLSLRNSVLVYESGFRFMVLRQAEIEFEEDNNHAINIHNVSPNRELSAANKTLLKQWLDALQAVIDVWDGEDNDDPNNDEDDDDGRRESMPKSLPRGSYKKKLSVVETDKVREFLERRPSNIDNAVALPVSKWLESLDLAHLTPVFEANGLADLRQLSPESLTPQVLDAMEIAHPLHRRVLLAMVQGVGTFTQTLTVRVLSHRLVKGGSSGVLLDVEAHFHSTRAVVSLRDVDLVRFHRDVKVALARDQGGKGADAPVAVPPLPCKEREAGEGWEARERRARDVQRYLQAVASTVGASKSNSHALHVLLRQFQLGSDGL